jgi:anaerobic magnesium-protoporphyrin IX monomethyl ester cyclase
MCKVLFVYPNKEGYPIIPTGISLLAGILESQGHEVNLFDITFMVPDKLDHEAREKTKVVQHVDVEKYWGRVKNLNIEIELAKIISTFKPDLIAFSIVENNYGCAKKLLIISRKLSYAPIIVGGIFPTVATDFFLKDDNVDLICIGEGELAIAKVAKRIDNNRHFFGIPNIVSKIGFALGNSRGQIAKFYQWSPPVFQNRKIFDQRHILKPFMGQMRRSGNFELSRGCPYGCSYCNNLQMQKLFKDAGMYRREKPIPMLIEEISQGIKECNLDLIFFNDENFLQMSRERFEEFCRRYKEINLPFFIQTRADTLLDEKRVIALKEVGCVTIGIGIEHGNEEIRKKVLNKSVSDKSFEKAFSICNSIGLRTTAYIMIGLPFETEENIMETVNFCKKIKAPSVAVSIFAPYHGTRLRRICLENGFIKDGYNDEISINYHSILSMPQISKHKIEELYYKMNDMIYD